MTEPRPGNYWKTPFIWEPGGLIAPPNLRFEPCTDGRWLHEATQAVIAHSLDQYDQCAVERLGAAAAAQELLRFDPAAFSVPEGWWRMALDANGHRVGFVLPAIFNGDKCWRGDRPETTIYYIGVLPAHRGRGYADELLAEAMRVCAQANSWRLFCDTGTDNAPMVRTFRKAGFTEREPWQRPTA